MEYAECGASVLAKGWVEAHVPHDQPLGLIGCLLQLLASELAGRGLGEKEIGHGHRGGSTCCGAS